jgi:hypothetical protein
MYNNSVNNFSNNPQTLRDNLLIVEAQKEREREIEKERKRGKNMINM